MMDGVPNASDVYALSKSDSTLPDPVYIMVDFGTLDTALKLLLTI